MSKPFKQTHRAMATKREEITDLFGDVYQEVDPETHKFVFRVGRVLKFNYEGSITTIKVTKIDRKAKRMWGVHIELVDQRIVRMHYGHEVDSDQVPPMCLDCQVPVTEPATEDGEKKYLDRRDNHFEDGTPIPQFSE